MEPLRHLSFAALDTYGTLSGLLQSWPVALRDHSGKEYPLVMVGPVAVLPALQQGGIGKLLMQRLMAEARKQQSDPLMMIGDPEYYGRFFGFSAAETGGWKAPGPVEPHRLLAQSVDGNSLPPTGILGPRTGLSRVA
jgi:predicted N-acetyltransferase YhbS